MYEGPKIEGKVAEGEGEVGEREGEVEVEENTE